MSGILLLLQFADYDLGLMETLAEAQEGLEPGQMLQGAGSGSMVEGETSPLTGKILLPAGFDFDLDVVRQHLKDTVSAGWPIAQLAKEDVVVAADMPSSRYMDHEAIPIYGPGRVEKEENCDNLGEVIDTLKVDERVTIPGNFDHVLRLFMDEFENKRDPYYDDIAPLFVSHLKAQLKANLVRHFWYRLSGSSVWLKDYNVHYVISRFLFSSDRIRDKPKASFVLAQLFDKDWKEIKDVRLVFPTNDVGGIADPETGSVSESPTFKVGDQDFYSYRYPRLLPVPFRHDYTKKGMYWLGPEDPRTILVRNKNGFDEPVVIANANHLKPSDEVDEKGEKKTKEYRSIFTVHPFQLKRGKFHVDAKYRESTDNVLFTKITEMEIVGRDKQGTNKNWAPLLSDNLRQSAGYDQFIYFATRLENLEVLQCDLEHGTGKCHVAYFEDGGIGPMRGGTNFLNVNTLLKDQTEIPVEKFIPPGREILVSLARAHLSDCGCGAKFYRPNLLVMVKETVKHMAPSGDGLMAEAEKQLFKVSHISGFMSLHVPIDPWNPDKPFSICDGVNAVIPNGINNWNIQSITASNGRWLVDDTLTVTFSVSDFTVDRINVKGILNALLNLDDGTLFLPAPILSGKEQARESFITQPELNEEGKITSGNIGYNGRNVKCAIDLSFKFCLKFGEEQLVIEDEHKGESIEEAKKGFHKEMELFKSVLRELEEEEKKAEEELKAMKGLEEF